MPTRAPASAPPAPEPAVESAGDRTEGAPVDGRKERSSGQIEPRVLELPLSGFEPALVVLPGGKARKRPLLVAAHGAGGRAEAHCALWNAIIGERGAVLCLRGKRLRADDDSSYYFPNHHALRKELVAALASVRSELADAVDANGVVYAGYSQGAIMGALVARQDGATLTRLILIEGGALEWDVPTARAFHRAGGKRVLLVCGHGGCARAGRRAAQWLVASGAAARVEHVAGAGHTWGGPVAERLRDTFEWVIEGDARWQP